ncbi:peptidoglycan DD-metalloendopeptidase family protein [Candidatus Enterococcus mangumiae]|uniref:Mannosyl-glycoprotein endo-beta-N-acetylglucosamidase-like domain-containing protein n=1 Tax=Candidatus Enterococcus mangumiae TaxID=2230878 RepID=A0ABZ2SUH2_9ENTE|nr:peptidoglycan DD-metalloendopeptidase family protein [Enterococcus sp. DIV1094]
MQKKFTHCFVSGVLLSQLLFITPLQIVADEKVLSTEQTTIDTISGTATTSEEQTETTNETSTADTTSDTYDTTDETSTADTTSDTNETTDETATTGSTSDTNETTGETTTTNTTTDNSEETDTSTEPSITKPTKPSQPQEPDTTGADDSNNQKEKTDQGDTEQKAPPQSVTPATPMTPEEEVNQPSPTMPIQDLVPGSEEIDKDSIHFEKDESVESFIRKIGESSRKIGQENGLYASVMIAQAILESASGQSQLAQAPNYNLFGIKGAYKGDSVSLTTQEDTGEGTLYSVQSAFRKYKNYEESLQDYAKLMTSGLIDNREFYAGMWKSHAKTYQEATKFLTGRYASDTRYNQKLNGLIETYDLQQYDKETTGPEVNQKGYITPLKNYTISSPFGFRDGEFHRGLDLAASQGEPIYASKAGTVRKAEFHSSWGNYVAIEHEDGTTALYAHQQAYTVKVGDHVAQGQIIGYVGSTGNSTGSHLHFEVSRDSSLNQSQLIDPFALLFLK